MTRVRRFDRIELRLDKAEKLSNGWLRADAVIGRVGVFPYLDANGETRHEFRSPDEVFHPDAMRSFELVPLTNEHPPSPLDDTTARLYTVGAVGNDVRRDGDHLRATVLLTDANAVALAEAGRTELSPGYTVELDVTQGDFRGVHYDARQTKIRGNHVARVDQGRQGPEVSIRLDSGDAVAATDNGAIMPKDKDDKGTEGRDDARTKKIKVGDDEHEVPSAVAGAFNKQAKRIEALEGKLEKLAKGSRGDQDDPPPPPPPPADVDKLRARLDALEAENKSMKDGEAARFDARVSLVTTAREVCGSDFRADGKKDADIMREVVAKVRPDAKLDGKSDGYVEGAYEHALEVHAARKDHGDSLLRAAAATGDREDEVDETEAARRKANADRENAWKKASE